MHYYQFHIGDYRAATAHLSNEEDLAYRRLLDMYYDTEKNIPLDTQWVSRRLRIKRDVIQAVLEDFFVLTDEGWVHEKCEEVIAHYHQNSIKNKNNGRLGGRPKKTQSVSSGIPVVTQQEPNQKATINQETSKPVNQEKEREQKPARVARASQLPADFTLTEASISYAQVKRVDLKTEFQSFINWHSAKGSTYKDWQAAWRSWCDKASVYNKNRPQKTEHQLRQDATARALFGDNPFVQTLKTIEGEILNATENPPRLLG